jgi:hypothetical protein
MSVTAPPVTAHDHKKPISLLGLGMNVFVVVINQILTVGQTPVVLKGFLSCSF